MVVHLDICGKVCPYPTTEVYKALTGLPPGEALEVLSDYPPARFTIPALARDLGFLPELHDHRDGRFRIVIQKSTDAVQ